MGQHMQRLRHDPWSEDIQECLRVLDDDKSTTQVKLDHIEGVLGFYFQFLGYDNKEFRKCLTLLRELETIICSSKDISVQREKLVTRTREKIAAVFKYLVPWKPKTFREIIEASLYSLGNTKFEHINSALEFKDLPQDIEEIRKCLRLLGELLSWLEKLKTVENGTRKKENLTNHDRTAAAWQFRASAWTATRLRRVRHTLRQRLRQRLRELESKQ